MKPYRLRKNDKNIIKIIECTEETFCENQETKHEAYQKMLKYIANTYKHNKLKSQRQKQTGPKSQVKEVRK